MKKFRKDVYLCCGYNTISLGTGRKEFHPKKPRPGIEHYIREAGKGVVDQIPGAGLIDECIVGNFMAARFNRQGNLAGLMPTIDPALLYKPCTRVEGACGSGGLALYTGIKSILAETADVVLVLGVEVQNTMKAIYGADVLAGAGHYASQRKKGHAYFFPGQFSDRAGAYQERYGKERVREAMAHWYVQAIEHARRCPQAQEYHNTNPNLFEAGMTPPNPKVFCDHLNVYDCSKVSDGASALLVCSEEGLKRIGVSKDKAAVVVGFGQSEDDLTTLPEDPCVLSTTKDAVRKAYETAGLTIKDIGVLEVHDCFTITGLLALEAVGLVEPGEAPDYVAEKKSRIDGEMPTNCSGGLIGFGHFTGGTGVRQGVDIMWQVTGQAKDWQARMDPNRPFGMMISMGGNDKTVSAMIVKKASE